MEKTKLGNVIKKISIGFAVFVDVLFAIGIVSLFYNSSKSRVPIYQTVMTDFELLVGAPEKRNDGSYSEMQHELQGFIDKFEINLNHSF